MNILEFILSVIGYQSDNPFILIIYAIVAGLLLLIMIDGIITFLISGITSLTMRGRK